MKKKRGRKSFRLLPVNGENILHKTCINCGIEKPVGEFFKQKGGVNGVRPRCKTCKGIEDRIYQRKNKDKINSITKKWRENNPDKHKEFQKRYVEKIRMIKSGDTSVSIRKYTPRLKK